MGDILSLVEQVEQTVDKQKAEKLAKKFIQGAGFNLEDYRTQIEQMQNMGGIGKIMEKMPGMGNIPQAAQAQVNDDLFKKNKVIIDSMTKEERLRPDLINGSRKRRIAMGSGTQLQDINRLLKQFTQMQKMMRKFSKGGMGKMMKMMQKMGGAGGMGGMLGGDGSGGDGSGGMPPGGGGGGMSGGFGGL